MCPSLRQGGGAAQRQGPSAAGQDSAPSLAQAHAFADQRGLPGEGETMCRSLRQGGGAAQRQGPSGEGQDSAPSLAQERARAYQRGPPGEGAESSRSLQWGRGFAYRGGLVDRVRTAATLWDRRATLCSGRDSLERARRCAPRCDSGQGCVAAEPPWKGRGDVALPETGRGLCITAGLPWRGRGDVPASDVLTCGVREAVGMKCLRRTVKEKQSAGGFPGRHVAHVLALTGTFCHLASVKWEDDYVCPGS
jgi:hypothetical protein